MKTTTNLEKDLARRQAGATLLWMMENLLSPTTDGTPALFLLADKLCSFKSQKAADKWFRDACRP
jgi:hypothetical protein